MWRSFLDLVRHRIWLRKFQLQVCNYNNSIRITSIYTAFASPQLIGIGEACFKTKVKEYTGGPMHMLMLKMILKMMIIQWERDVKDLLTWALHLLANPYRSLIIFEYLTCIEHISDVMHCCVHVRVCTHACVSLCFRFFPNTKKFAFPIIIIYKYT